MEMTCPCYPFDEYFYRGEGNAHFVIAHHTKNTVIRLRKSFPEEEAQDGGFSRVIRDIGFSKNVIRTLLGTYIDVPKVVHFNKDSIEKLLQQLQSDRPIDRLSVAVLEEFGIELPDYSMPIPSNLYPSSCSSRNGVLCVEIKPKQGYICKMDRKFPTCPYCLKQFYKAKTKKHKKKIENCGRKWQTLPYERSQYCPLDLFSGDRDRMKRALMNIMDNPQNNLRMFRDGLSIYQENSPSLNNATAKSCMNDLFPNEKDWMNQLSTLLVNILLHPFMQIQDEKTNALGDKFIEISSSMSFPARIDSTLVSQAQGLLLDRNQICNFSEGILPMGSVLERIVSIQKLHQHGHDIVHSIYAKYSEVLDDEFIHSYLIERLQQRRNVLIEDMHFNNECNYNEKENIASKLETKSNSSFKYSTCDNHTMRKYPSTSELCILQNYLLFSTFRDCSVMVAIQRLDPGEEILHAKENLIYFDNRQYLVNVKISDVDLKSLRCIESHRKRDEQVMNAVISTLTARNRFKEN